MIPMMNIVAWGKTVPWAEPKQVEQDLIISRALVELFSDPFLRAELRFRGGTALNKLHFPKPLRYSEDIDLTRTTAGAIGPVLDRVRGILEPWLGKANFDQSPVAPKLYFHAKAEDETAAPIRLKVEINTRERTAHDPARTIPFAVENPWFSGSAGIETFSHEEILATKLRALLQRDKGRDLIDLSHATDTFGSLNAARAVELFRQYLMDAGQELISRAQAEERMLAKIARRNFLADVRPLLSAEEAAKFDDNAARAAFRKVFTTFIKRIPGKQWALTPEKSETLGMPSLWMPD
jgi:predicted nucleotidyltransferase component of viral defense system